MPRVAIENLKLIEIDDLINLIGKDLEGIRYAMADSSYQKQLSAVSSTVLDYRFLEVAILQNYAETIQKLIEFSSGNIKKLLVALSKKVEVANIKTILRATKAQIDVKEALKNIVPLGDLDVDRCQAILAEAKSIGDVIIALQDFKYGEVLKPVGENEGKIDLTLLEVALDKAVYREILGSIEKLTGIDEKIAKAVLGIELDVANVKTILKGKELEVNPKIIEEYLMPPAFFTEDILEEAMETADVKSMMESLALIVESGHMIYKKIIAQLLKESDAPLSLLEAILNKAPLEMSLYQLREHSRYYNIGFILAFLNLKWAEVKNLRCVVKGSERKIPFTQVQKLLMIPDDWRPSQLICRSS
ncbi:MAG: V-type ATPase subunit [Candidatus Bathyarchaeota archaeon]|nr:V-type ATPase subunit [Candidatus Bathyarchaeota archaeon]